MTDRAKTGGRFRSIQFRVTLVATLAVLVLLAGASLLLIRSFELRLLAEVDDQLVANAEVMRNIVASGNTATIRRDLAPLDLVVQLVDRRGVVVGGTASGRDLPAMVTPDVDAESAVFQSVTLPEVGALRVLAEPNERRASALLVGRPIGQVNDAVASLKRLMLTAIPVIAALLGGLIWWVVGRSLRPVEDVRRTVGAISENDLTSRVPVPDTGDEIARLVDTMNGMLDRVEGAVRRERQFVADASHELRSPLAGARALLETEDDDPAAIAETRAETLATLARLEAVAEQMLQLASADGGTGERSPRRPVDLDELVLAQASRLRRTTALTIDTSGVSGGQVRGWENELGRLIENLSANAVRHATSVIRFAVIEDGDWVELVVADDGPGVPPAERERIFLRFARLDDSRTSGAGGAGLGLSIVAGIVADHGGTITVDKSDLGGARFVARLPKES